MIIECELKYFFLTSFGVFLFCLKCFSSWHEFNNNEGKLKNVFWIGTKMLTRKRCSCLLTYSLVTLYGRKDFSVLRSLTVQRRVLPHLHCFGQPDSNPFDSPTSKSKTTKMNLMTRLLLSTQPCKTNPKKKIIKDSIHNLLNEPKYSQYLHLKAAKKSSKRTSFDSEIVFNADFMKEPLYLFLFPSFLCLQGTYVKYYMKAIWNVWVGYRDYLS